MVWGSAQVAAVLEKLGVYAVATGSFQDALAVRRAGLGVKIHLFSGNLPEAIPALLAHHMIPTVCDLETALAVSRASAQTTSVFIKIDAGLGRLGVPIGQAEQFVAQVAQMPHVRVEGLFTHLPFSSAAELTWALPHLAQFDDLIGRLREAGYAIPITQSLASSGVVCGIQTQTSAVCVGHLLCGPLNRVSSELADLARFRPVLAAIRTRLIHITRYSRDTSVGALDKTPLPAGGAHGVVPIGRCNGYRPPVAGERAAMLVAGQRAPVLGVSQEYVTPDLSQVDSPQIGDEVVVLGKMGSQEITVEEMAGWWGALPLDLLMAFNTRFPARYRGAN